MPISSRSLPALALCIILAASAAFMAHAALTDAPIMDELAHIPAGYSYVRYLDYRDNPEHPPLMKALAELPLLAVQPHFPTDSAAWTTGVNAQWDLGALFLYGSGNDPKEIVALSRIVPIIITLLTILLVYFVGRELVGRWWGLLPAFLFALSPNVLAHGHYVTTDMAATLGILLATWLFVRYFESPTRGRLVLAGLAFGIAQLMKFSAFLLVPFFCMLAVIWAFAAWRRGKLAAAQGLPRATGITTLSKALWSTALVFIIGFILVYAVYALFTAGYPADRQLSDTTHIITSFVTPEWWPGVLEGLTSNPVIRPFAQYILGLSMVFSRAAGGNTSYFLGAVTNTGWWYYFPVTFLLKEPLPSLILLLIGVGVGAGLLLVRMRDRRGNWKRLLDFLGTHFMELSLGAFIAVYWVVSMRSPLNIGVRHVLPTIPMIYLLVAVALKRWTYGSLAPLQTGGFGITGALAMLWTGIQNAAKVSAKYLLIVILLVWYLLEASVTAPYFLSYFNELAGGTANGYRVVTDSNYDWGQDLNRLAEWVNMMRQDPSTPMSKIAIDYFGGGNVERALGAGTVERWGPSKGSPVDSGIQWFVASVNSLEGGVAPTVNNFTRSPSDTYGWLTAIRPPDAGMGGLPKPDYRIGTTLFVYRFQ